MRVNDIRRHFINDLQNQNFVQDKSGVKLLEMAGSYFLADEPAIFGIPNQDYIERELVWYKSQSRSVNDFPGGAPTIWRQVSNDAGLINSNYGWCIYSAENSNQYDFVKNELTNHPLSRRAIMIYTRPSIWNEYNQDGMSDFICTNTVQYLIRNSQLDVYVNMRSNDAVFGYKNDYAWQKHVQHNLAADLNIKPGNIWWFATSLHVYERHFNLIR